MDDNEKVEALYHELYMNILRHNIDDNLDLKKYKYDIKYKELIKKLVDSGNDYLLTKTFMWFLVFGYSYCSSSEVLLLFIYENLMNLNDPDKRVFLIKKYIYYLNDNLLSYELNDNEKELNASVSTMKINLINKFIYHKDHCLMEDAIYVIATDSLINKRECEEFESTCKAYIDDWKNKVEEVRLQLNLIDEKREFYYKYDEKEFVRYVLNQINNDCKREIR